MIVEQIATTRNYSQSLGNILRFHPRSNVLIIIYVFGLLMLPLSNTEMQ